MDEVICDKYLQILSLLLPQSNPGPPAFCSATLTTWPPLPSLLDPHLGLHSSPIADFQ